MLIFTEYHNVTTLPLTKLPTREQGQLLKLLAKLYEMTLGWSGRSPFGHSPCNKWARLNEQSLGLVFNFNLLLVLQVQILNDRVDIGLFYMTHLRTFGSNYTYWVTLMGSS